MAHILLKFIKASTLCVALCIFFVPISMADVKVDKNKNGAELELIRKARDAKTYKARYQILKALVDQNSYKAMYRMGDLMLMGDFNLIKNSNPYFDPYKAFELIFCAARAGEAQAQWGLAVMLTRDPYLHSSVSLWRKEQYRWNRASAEQGYAPAQQALGEMLIQDSTEQDDYIEAYMWLTLAYNRYKAKEQRDEIYDEWADFARRFRDRLVNKGYINNKQVREALKNVKEWEKEHPNAYRHFPVDEQDY